MIKMLAAIIIILALAIMAFGKPPQEPKRLSQEPPAQVYEPMEYKTPKKVKRCHCSSQCTCGCAEGLPCNCEYVSEVTHSGSFAEPRYWVPPPAPKFRVITPAPVQSIPQGFTPTYRYTPAPIYYPPPTTGFSGAGGFRMMSRGGGC